MQEKATFRHEVSQLIKLAAPVSLAQLSLVGMSATDVLIAGKAGTLELAGMNLGVNTWNMIILFFMGVGFATQPLVAKQFGAKNIDGVKHQLNQSLWMCLALGLLATLLVWLVYWGLQFANFEKDMLSIAREFLLVISFCAVPMTLIPAVRGTLEGINLTRVVFLLSFVIFLVNIPLDYILVNGLYGFPRLGGVGCAWATAILMWLGFFALLLIAHFHPKTRQQNLLRSLNSPDFSSIKRTLVLGVPIGASIVIELSMFAGAGMLIALFGPIEAGAHAVAITVASLSFMIYMGISQGITIRASQFLGANMPLSAWYTIKVGLRFNLLLAVCICVIFIYCNEALIRLFSDDESVIPLAVTLLYFGAAFQIADCLQVTAVHGLRAYHDTASPPRYQLIAFWVFGLPIGIGLGFTEWFDGLEGAKGMWFAMVTSLTTVGLLLFWRLLSLSKQNLDLE
ncbi:MAG: MATE family efflux transporter [Gammaproteobacteria bacterium]|nr:MATE family efflux transporter [Gammaproteobacteria bacterium]